MLPTYLGLIRSLLIYYGQPHKLLRMVDFYRQFIRPGDLCFDVGAHVGSRIWAWRRLGARIIAVEPQAGCMHFLRLLYGNKPAITWVDQAVGSTQGIQYLNVSYQTPAVSSLSSGWIAAVREDPSFADVRWEGQQSVSVTTLDTLVSQYGEPAFCKIDVEGYELEALQGLSSPLPALSFEFLATAREIALGCISRLEELGSFEYNWSTGESHRLGSVAWVSQKRMASFLEAKALDRPQGDIYARLAC